MLTKAYNVYFPQVKFGQVLNTNSNPQCRSCTIKIFSRT